MSSNFYDLQKFATTGIASPEMTHFDKMRALAAFSGKVQTMTGIPPLSFKANGKPLLSLEMIGNGVQTGTPSPQNIVPFDGSGVKTGNLFDWNWLVDGYHIAPATGLPAENARRTGILNPILVDTTGLFISYTKIGNDNIKAIYSILDSNDSLVRRVTNVDSGAWIDATGGTKLYIAFYDSLESSNTVTKNNIGDIMLNLGSTAQPYEPYGWKIPVTCGNVTTPLYLGERQTVRQVRKYVFTGEENITDLGDYYNTNISVSSLPWSRAVSNTGGFQINNSGNRIWAVKSHFSDYATSDAFKSYLAAQYAAGTPVTVWYVLAEPETGITNEPLMKIGDYADTMTVGSGIIQTAKGSNILTVGTTVQPSEVTIAYK